MDWKLFIMTFTVVFLAELPDKTAFATLMMATQGRSLPIFVGVAIAFAVQSLVAVVAGGVLSLLPQIWVHLAAAIMFGVFSIIFWRRKEEMDGVAPGAP